jgi:LysM repeat protein
VVVKGDIMANIAKKFHVSLKDLQTANPGVVPAKLAIGTKLKIPEATMASASASASAAAAVGGSVYVVKSGDNLTKIATAHGTTVKELEALNNLKNSSIKAGEKLKLPEKGSTTSAPIPTPAAPAATASNPTPDAPVMR